MLILIYQAYKLMASIDKQSIRAEFDKIKTSFDEQVQSGKVSSETAALVNTLMMLFNIILSIFMEKNTKKTSENIRKHQQTQAYLPLNWTLDGIACKKTHAIPSK
ncbi:MAG: hypothetical protein Q8R24_05050 [Legionellaceae bacterium]|nr:hypothetical protein [Legionellaceae bacterium]